MPETRRSLIQTARAQQFEALQKATTAGKIKPARVGMGVRNPQTGQHDTLLPDGSVEPGDRAFTASLPTGAQVLGTPKEAGGWRLDERDVSPVLPTGVTAKVKTKVGYVFSKVASGSTAIICPAAPDPGGGGGSSSSFSVPTTLTTPYHPVPVGQMRRVFIRLVNNASVVSDSLGSFPGSGASDQTFGPFDVDSTFTVRIRTVVGDQIGLLLVGPGPVFATITSNTSTQFEADGAGLAIISAVTNATNGTIAVTETRSGGQVFLSFDSPVPLPSPSNGGTPGGTPEDPANPYTPDPVHSLEFWYQGDKAAAPIKLKSLAANQPLEAKPYLLHKSGGLSYVILKYGKAGNDGGAANDWCKLSLFKIAGGSVPTVTEAIYGWAQEAALITALQAIPTPFAAVVGSKATAPNLPALITAGKLDAQWRCFTHRNLDNLKRSGVFLLDPILLAPSPLSDLVGEGIYTYGAITANLVMLDTIAVNLRFFKLVPNPAYTGSAEDCTTNPAYLLKEQASKSLKRVKLKGLGSTDTSIKILTIAVGVIP